MSFDKLKEAGVNIHVIATGSGAGIQKSLWEVPGSSAYLSGATFPYDQAEQEELLGFMPDKFVCEEAAVDLASVAYMKAYKFGGKKAIGLGLTASVASEREHRGDHQVFVCLMTDTQVLMHHYVLEKGVGAEKRKDDGSLCDYIGRNLLLSLVLGRFTNTTDVTELARKRFFERPFFSYDGKRYKDIPNIMDYALMPGSFNPPHEGHLGVARAYRRAYGRNVVFEVGTNPPHKAAPTVQELLQRAKMLQGQDRFFSTDIPRYIEKAKAFPGMPIVIGADTLIRMFDPKWGVDINEMLETFKQLGTKFAVTGRMIEGHWVSGWDAVVTALADNYKGNAQLFVEMDGRWDISSSELRNKIK